MRNVRTLAQLAFRIFLRPFFPFLQWLFFTFGLLREPKTYDPISKRQHFLIGNVAVPVGAEDMQEKLLLAGFFPNRVAYTDPGQLLSMRRLSDIDPTTQYHVRVFSDGEVRGHYEYTPEDKPIAHLQETLFEARTEEFMKLLNTIEIDTTRE